MKKCFICDAVSDEMQKIERIDVARDKFEVLFGDLFIRGFALGFNIRHETSYFDVCKRHEGAVSEALQRAGCRPVSVSPKPQGSQ
jgi:hypothetical protein